MGDVDTVVGRLHVEESGSGPAVLFWPSLLTDGSLWRAQAEDASRDHRVLVVDPPGHGRSGVPPGPFTLEACADALVEILDARGVPSAVLVGLSWGGMTAMRAALRAPSRVRALALFDTSADAERRVARFRYRVMAAVFRWLGLVRALERPVLEAMFCDRTRRERPELGRELLGRVRTWDRRGVALAVAAVVLDRGSILSELPRIAAPTLVVVGEEDRATRPRESEKIAAAIPGARLERVPGAGHLAALEAPAEVTRLLRGFLEGLSP